MQQQSLTTEQLAQLRGQPVRDIAGEEIGAVEAIFYDEQTNQPEWLGIGTGALGTKRVLVPVVGATERDGGVAVPYAKDQVQASPDIDSDEIPQQLEQELYSYYGLDYSEQRSASGLPEGKPPSGAAQPGMTRSEEELRVSKQPVEAGRARLRKWVATEPVSVDVELQREAARVTRQPVDQPVADAELGEQEIEVPLRAEQAVVEKQVVAKERIGIETDVETERRTVTDEVRKERVDVDERS